MKIIVNTNVTIRKFLRIYYMTLRREPTSDMFKFSDFFSENFQKAAEVSEIIHKHTSKRSLQGVWFELLDRNLKKNGSKGEMIRLQKVLDQISIHVAEQDTTSVKSSKERLFHDFKKYEKLLTSLIKRTFAFELPESLDIILDIAPRFGQGNFVTSKPPVIALTYPEYTTNNFSTIIHELLHYLIFTNNMKQRLNVIDPNFEEALLDYFCPHGIFDEKLGIGGKLDLEKHQAQQAQNRPVSAGISKKLLPLMKQYNTEEQESHTIWEFLDKNGFSISNS